MFLLLSVFFLPSQRSSRSLLLSFPFCFKTLRQPFFQNRYAGNLYSIRTHLRMFWVPLHSLRIFLLNINFWVDSSFSTSEMLCQFLMMPWFLLRRCCQIVSSLQVRSCFSHCLLLSLFFVFNFQKFDYVVSLCLLCLGFAQLLKAVGLYLFLNLVHFSHYFFKFF